MFKGSFNRVSALINADDMQLKTKGNSPCLWNFDLTAALRLCARHIFVLVFLFCLYFGFYPFEFPLNPFSSTFQSITFHIAFR